MARLRHIHRKAASHALRKNSKAYTRGCLRFKEIGARIFDGYALRNVPLGEAIQQGRLRWHERAVREPGAVSEKRTAAMDTRTRKVQASARMRG
jgi:hypothetical protein